MTRADAELLVSAFPPRPKSGTVEWTPSVQRAIAAKIRDGMTRAEAVQAVIAERSRKSSPL